jgi:hypothetical protein
MLTVLLLLSDVRTPEPRPVQTLDLSKMTWQQACRIEGKQVRVTFTTDSFPEDNDGETLGDAMSKGWPARGVRFARGCAGCPGLPPSWSAGVSARPNWTNGTTAPLPW